MTEIDCPGAEACSGAMTRELLEDYPHICGELRDLDRLVTDTVSGSLPEPPFIRHTVSVRGVPYTERRARLEKQKAEIETFVESLPEAGLRRIVTYRVMEGLPWAQVAARMGGRWSEEAVKKRYQRFFQKM